MRNNVASIEDILSIPRLVSTCIRGGWWNEAVDLAFRARELEDILKSPSSATTHNKDTGKSRRSLLGKVREDVEDELEALRSRIIEGLRGRGLKLPSAVRSIALLRRLSSAAQTVTKVTEGLEESKSLSEPELRLTFLASRWDCLRSQLDQLEMSASSAASSDDRLRSIKRWIEIWREVVGETVNIYNEIFLTSLPSPPARTSPLPLSSKEMPATPQSDTTHSPLALSEASPPLALFLTQAQNALRSLLQTQLPHLSAVTSLVSLQTQLSYCAAAFSKFGFDFRHIPHRAIASRLLQITCERFDIAVETFRKDLSRALTQSGARSGKPRLVISALVAAESCDSIAALEESDLSNLTSNKTSHAAAFIALFPPLAKLLNNYATALNELRLLPITSLYPTVVRTLRVSLNEATANMVQFVKIALESQKAYPEDDDQAEAEEQTMILRKSSLILSRCILPWVSWALDEVVYPDIRKERWKDKDKTLDEAIAQLHESLGIQTKVDEPQEESTSVSNGAAKPETSKAEGADEPNDSRHENGVINDVSKEAKPVQAEGRPVEGDVQEKTTPDKDIEDALDEQ